MQKKVLITGITGFVGRHTARAILAEGKYDLTAIVRPNTERKRLEEFIGKVEIVEIDLCDLESLEKYLESAKFDTILHIGAILRQRKFTEEQYFSANVEATEILAKNALVNKSKFIFCSSVGVYGTIPKEVPGNSEMGYCGDTLYHETKFEAEKRIKALLDKGLKSFILRPCIIYGLGDDGFPNKLIKLIDKRILFFSRKNIKLSLTNIDLLVRSFIVVLDGDFDSFEGIIVDENPVSFKELANYINLKLKGKPYSNWHIIPNFLFILALFFSDLFRLKQLKNQILFLCKDWYYNFELKKILELNEEFLTIPDIKMIIEEYKSGR